LPPDVTVPLASVAIKELELLTALSAAGNATATMSVRVKGAYIVAAVLSLKEAQESDSGSVTVSVDGAEGLPPVSVGVPAEVILGLSAEAGGPVALLATSLSSHVPPPEEAPAPGEAAVEVWAMVGLTFKALGSGADLNASNLSRPIEFSMPVNSTAGLLCAFWHEPSQRWLTNGVDTLTSGPGQLRCNAFHTTLFAAIFRGFLSALRCSQADLFSRQAFEDLLRPGWTFTPAAVGLWVLLVFFIGTVSLAVVVDFRRTGSTHWSDDSFFMLPDAAAAEEEAPQRGLLVTCCSLCGSICGQCFSGPMRDGIDELISNLFAYFGQVRELLELLYAGLAEEVEAGSQVTGRLSLIACMVVAMIMKQVVSASMRVHPEETDFVMKDPSIQTLARVPGDVPGDVPELKEKGVVRADSVASAASLACSQNHQVLLERRNTAGLRLGSQVEGFSCLKLPRIVLSIFLVQHPLGDAFMQNIFISSMLRVFLLSCNVLGALAIATFFTATASGRSSWRNDDDKGSNCQPADIWEQIGHLVAIGLGSALVGSGPIMLLSAMHSRSLKRIPEGAARRRQLRAWRCQDAFIVAVGILYSSLCFLLMVLFVAGVSAKDQQEWLIAVGTTMLADFFIMPATVAILLPLIALALLLGAFCSTGVRPRLVLDVAVQSARGGLQQMQRRQNPEAQASDGGEASDAGEPIDDKADVPVDFSDPANAGCVIFCCGH